MSAPSFHLSIPVAASGDMIAASLRAVADRFHNEVDGLTPPASEGVHRVGGRVIAEWKVEP